MRAHILSRTCSPNSLSGLHESAEGPFIFPLLQVNPFFFQQDFKEGCDSLKKVSMLVFSI